MEVHRVLHPKAIEKTPATYFESSWKVRQFQKALFPFNFELILQRAKDVRGREALHVIVEAQVRPHFDPLQRQFSIRIMTM